MKLPEDARQIFENGALPEPGEHMLEGDVLELKRAADAHLAVISHQVVVGLVEDEARKQAMLQDFFRSSQPDISSMFEITLREQTVVVGRFFSFLRDRYGSGKERDLLDQTELGRVTKKTCLAYHDEAQRILNNQGVETGERGPVDVYADPEQIIRIGLDTAITATQAVVRQLYQSTEPDSARRLAVLRKSRPSVLRLAQLPLHIAAQESESRFEADADRVVLHDSHLEKMHATDSFPLQSVRGHSGCLGLIRLPMDTGQPMSAVNLLYSYFIDLIAEAKIEQLDSPPQVGELVPPFKAKQMQVLQRVMAESARESQTDTGLHT